MSDLTGKRTRIVVQGFDYSRYRPAPGDLWTWTRPGAARRAPPTSASSRRTTRASPTGASTTRCSTSRAACAARRLPAPPADPEQLVLYATASEGQAQPAPGRRPALPHQRRRDLHHLLAPRRARRRRRSASTRTRAWCASRRGSRRRGRIWMPRGDTSSTRPSPSAWWTGCARAGRSIVTDPDGVHRDAAGGGPSLAAAHDALIGAPLGPARRGSILEVAPGALGAGAPDDLLTSPSTRPDPRAFAAVPAGARSWPVSSTARRPRSCAAWAPGGCSPSRRT